MAFQEFNGFKYRMLDIKHSSTRRIYAKVSYRIGSFRLKGEIFKIEIYVYVVSESGSVKKVAGH